MTAPFMDDPIYKLVRAALYGADHDEENIFSRHGIIAKTGADNALDAIPPDWLKTKEGRFVKVRPFWDPMRGGVVPDVYEVILEDQP